MNAVVFNVNYRLGPETKCPDDQQDFVDAIRYIHANASTFGVDANKLAIGGESGGGWIAAGAANLMIKDGDIDKVKAILLETPMVSDECPKYPAEELDDYEKTWGFEQHGLTNTFHLLAKDYIKQQDDGQLYPSYASDEVMKQYPPTFIWTMEFDFLKKSQ